MIRADRLGDWLLHVNTVKKLLPIFNIFDRINYTRWCSLYIQDILKLPDTKPELYEKFLSGQFTVNRSSIPFTSVGTDQALEQTINRSQKSSSGTIGFTQKKEYVAAWNLNHHEILSVCNFYREVTNVKCENHELQLHHDFSSTTTERSEKEVEKIMEFIISHGNPFAIGTEQLKNLVTQELITSDCSESLLNVFEISINFYSEFFKERFTEKLKSLSDTIPKINFPNIKSVQQIKSVSNKSISDMKQNKIAHKVIELAKERNFNLRRLFSFELTVNNNLFNDNGSLKKEKSKSDLIRELEAKAEIPFTANLEDLSNFTLIVDVMLIFRKLKWKGMKTFKDFAVAFCNFVYSQSKKGVNRIDFIFDSYVENSLKLGERLERYKNEAIDMNVIHENVPMPKQENLFWGSNKNKTLLQNFIRNYVFEKSQELWPETEIICSATNEKICEINHPFNTYKLATLQRNDIEEADSRIILHSFHACTELNRKILVLSSDTDVVVLLLYYWIKFEEQGLQVIFYLFIFS